MYRKILGPINVQLEITPNCNNDCLYCYNHWRKDKRIQYSETEEAKVLRAAEKILDFGISSIVITGGEPLYRPALIKKLLKICNESKTPSALNSNLVLMSEKNAKELREAGLKKVLTSFMSFDERIHDKIANKPMAWRRAIQGMTNAQNADIKVSVNMVVNKINHKQVYETAKFFHDNYGVTNFSATKVSAPVGAESFEDLRLSPEELKGTLDQLVLAEKDFGLKVDSLECYPLCFLEDLGKYHWLLKRNCRAGVTSAAISHTGQLRPCSHSNEEYGNIHEESIETIWARMSKYRDGSLIPAKCRECHHLALCSAGCRIDALQKGSLSGLDPLVPESFDIKIPLQTNPINISKRSVFEIKKDIRFRKEKTGSIVFSRNSMAILDDRSTALLGSLPDRFTTAIFKRMDKKDVEVFLKVLISRGILKVDSIKPRKGVIGNVPS